MGESGDDYLQIGEAYGPKTTWTSTAVRATTPRISAAWHWG